MTEESFENRDARLKKLLSRITSLTDELKLIEDGGDGDYAKTYKALCESREHYRRLTGLYPILSPTIKLREEFP